jgi:hypothetical protein
MKYIVQIPNPCNENWNKMTPTEKGAFCMSCQKEVLDFTNKSDYQLAKLLDSKTKLCGKFKPEQLNREIPSVKNTYYSKLTTLFGVSVLLAMSTPVYANHNSTDTIAIVEQNVNKNLAEKSEIQKDSIQVSGQVFYEKEPLPGANIIVKGKTYGTQTDSNGIFNLKIPKEQNGKYPDIEISYVGFESQLIQVNHTTGFQKIQMKEDIAVLGMLISKRQNIFRRIGNLFRKR